jgi:hypothetical protein
MSNKTKKKSRRLICILLSFIILVIIALWNQPVNRTYTVKTDKLKSTIKIVHLSDLHSTKYGKNQERLIKRVTNENPDLVVLTGDIVDDIKDEEGAYLLVKGLVDEYPVYYVSGNHENWHLATESIYQELVNMGVVVLRDRHEIISINGEEIMVAGIMDPDRSIKSNQEVTMLKSLNSVGFDEIPEGTSDLFTVLLTHRPEYYELYKKYPIDIVLTGHSHGGQVRIPFLINGLYAPDQGYFPKYAGGYYKMKTYDMIVSRGLSLSFWLPRVFNPPEVVIINVIGGEDEE